VPGFVEFAVFKEVAEVVCDGGVVVGELVGVEGEDHAGYYDEVVVGVDEEVVLVTVADDEGVSGDGGDLGAACWGVFEDGIAETAVLEEVEAFARAADAGVDAFEDLFAGVLEGAGVGEGEVVAGTEEGEVAADGGCYVARVVADFEFGEEREDGFCSGVVGDVGSDVVFGAEAEFVFANSGSQRGLRGWDGGDGNRDGVLGWLVIGC